MSAYSDDVVRRMKEAAATFEERSAVYKDNVHMVGKVMEALFPDGHTQQDEQDHNRWHIFELMIVKITRYVLNYDSGGHEDSLTDLAVYATMLNALDQEAATLATPEADAGFAEYKRRREEHFAEVGRAAPPRDEYGHGINQRPPTPSQIEQGERGTVKCLGCNGVLRFVSPPDSDEGAWRHTGHSYSG